MTQYCPHVLAEVMDIDIALLALREFTVNQRNHKGENMVQSNCGNNCVQRS